MMMVMRRLSGQEIVRIWEVGLGQHPLDQAITILMSVYPEASHDTLALLSIGQRDACLFKTREQTFGQRLSSLAVCPVCKEQIEFILNMADMRITPNIEPIDEVFALITDEGELHFRLPNSLDLAAIIDSQNLVDARKLLMQRCVLQASQRGSDVAVETLPETLIAALATHMDTCDPLAVIEIPLDCPACGHQWQILFDIVSFFWTEISAQAKRLLHEVHTLASLYGWREADILSLSSVRRQFYLEMVT